MDLTMFFKIIALPFILIALLACATPSKAAELKELNAEQVHKMMDNSNVVIIDTRQLYEYEAGHIHGALNMAYFNPGDVRNTVTKDALKPYQDKNIIFYCRTGRRAFHAAHEAIEWNISSNIYRFKGGWPAWQTYTKSTDNYAD